MRARRPAILREEMGGPLKTDTAKVSLPADGWRARGGSRGVEDGVPSLPFAQLTNDRLNKIAPAVLQEIFIKHACFSPDAKRAYWST